MRSWRSRRFCCFASCAFESPVILHRYFRQARRRAGVAISFPPSSLLLTSGSITMYTMPSVKDLAQDDLFDSPLWHRMSHGNALDLRM